MPTHRCMEITKHKGTGWRSLCISLPLCGIAMTSRIGASIIPLSQPMLAVSGDTCATIHCSPVIISLTVSCRGTILNKEWFALDSSRGYESLWSMAYMRWTVIALDASIYFPAVAYFCTTHWKSRSRRSQVCLCTVCVTEPTYNNP